MSIRRSQVLDSDIFSHLTSIGYLPRWLVLFIDTLLCAVAFYIAYALSIKLYYSQFPMQEVAMETRMLITVGSQIVCFWIFHTYSGILRYSSYVDIVKLLMSIGLNLVILFAIHHIALFFFGEGIFLRAGLLIYGVVAFLFLLSVRVGVKTVYDYLIIHSGQIIPVVVYGTQAAGVSIAKMIRSATDTKYRLVGFLGDSQGVNDKLIFGMPVVSTANKEKMLRFLTRKKVRAMIVSPFKMKEIDPAHDLDVFLEHNIEILTVPSMNEWHEGDNLVDVSKDLKNIQIEELLNRRPIEIDKQHIVVQVKDKVVMVTGAAGSIGSEIVRQLAHYNPRLLVLYDNAETPLHNLKLELEELKTKCLFVTSIGDVRNLKRSEHVMESYRPDIIYHAAAYKHVPMMEDAPSECVIANVSGTKNMADLAVKFGVKTFVMVSTDKAVNPTNVMGASKRIAEIYVQSLFKKMYESNPETTKFITTRFGNVLGSNGSVIPLFKHQIEKGGPITVTHPDIIRYFMTIPEACQLVLEAGSMGQGGEIFIFDMGKPVKIVDLARKMIRLAGYKPDVDIQITYTGLRPGEKLYEELLNVKEATQPTYHEKIMIAKVREYDFDEIEHEVAELLKFASLYKNYMVVSKMKKIVPEYISKNSQYERLDMEMKK
ncbi:MAG TPA: nucleoside-diphosphate sugar epimerase/dehydratase [Paludibacteraceae bacterium]|nr:nucleoside-diphosphate sugar epimerase/dehydratase [Paludibacteraceae bacterium]